MNGLSLEDERIRGGLIEFVGEVDDRRLFCLERCATSLPVYSIVDDGFEAFTVTLRCRSSNPCSKVVHEGYRPSVTVDSSLYQVGIEEEEQNRREWRALRQTSLCQVSDRGGLPIDVDRRSAFGTTCLYPSKQLFSSMPHAFILWINLALQTPL